MQKGERAFYMAVNCLKMVNMDWDIEKNLRAFLCLGMPNSD